MILHCHGLAAVLTAAKKVILKLRLDPFTPVMFTGMSYLPDVALLECTTARVHEEIHTPPER